MLGITQGEFGSPSSSSSGGGSSGGYTQIAKNILVAPAASVTFSAIPQTFSHLELRALARLNGNNGSYRFTINSGTTYDLIGSLSTGVGVNVLSSSAQLSLTTGQNDAPGSGNTAGVVGQLRLGIPDYNNTIFDKTIEWFSGMTDVAIGVSLAIFANGLVRSSAAAVTSVIITNSSSQFIAGSSFSLYGII